jgi:hypothetical protein
MKNFAIKEGLIGKAVKWDDKQGEIVAIILQPGADGARLDVYVLATTGEFFRTRLSNLVAL